ncbi:MAG: hypothetical protein HY867_16085 [Chloroflexi bacterium]|nr:hypothetical protein [Chloroflexota bacterium]
MEPNAFYALFSTTCFALVGLWWNAVSARIKAFKEPRMKQNATGVYFSFLIPGMMGLGAQVAGAENAFWRVVFVAGAAIGIIVWVRIVRGADKPNETQGFFRRHRWVMIVLYALIALGSLGADRALAFTGVTPIQVEAFLMCLLVLAGHGLSWETLMEVTPPAE